MPVPKDDNNLPIVDERFAVQSEKLITFAGGTTNAIGDHDGTNDPFTIFSVTGTVAMKIVGIVETTLVGAATLEVGVAGNTAALIAQVANATGLAAGEIYHDNSPDSSLELVSVMPEKIVANGLDVIGTVGTANITAGAIRFLCFWYPLSKDGNVVAA